MHANSIRLVAVVTLLAALATPAAAGTQDFRLVNQTGVEIYNLFISESNNTNWEEDVLGLDVLPNGSSVVVTFSGREACLWDMMVTDDEGGNVTWEGLNLCETAVVVLRCSDSECWAETE